jgi:hypothetical protein
MDNTDLEKMMAEALRAQTELPQKTPPASIHPPRTVRVVSTVFTKVKDCDTFAILHYAVILGIHQHDRVPDGTALKDPSHPRGSGFLWIVKSSMAFEPWASVLVLTPSRRLATNNRDAIKASPILNGTDLAITVNPKD